MVRQGVMMFGLLSKDVAQRELNIATYYQLRKDFAGSLMQQPDRIDSLLSRCTCVSDCGVTIVEIGNISCPVSLCLVSYPVPSYINTKPHLKRQFYKQWYPSSSLLVLCC